MAGDHSAIVDLRKNYELEPAVPGAELEGSVMDAILLEELLDELDEIDPNGRRIAEVLLDVLDDRAAAKALGIAQSTYSDKKLKFRREPKKRRNENLYVFFRLSRTDSPFTSNSSCRPIDPRVAEGGEGHERLFKLPCAHAPSR